MSSTAGVCCTSHMALRHASRSRVNGQRRQKLKKNKRKRQGKEDEEASQIPVWSPIRVGCTRHADWGKEARWYLPFPRPVLLDSLEQSHSATSGIGRGH